MKPLAASPATAAARAVDSARQASVVWSATPISERVAVVRRLRHHIAENPLELASTVRTPWRGDAATTLTAEILPLLDACKFLEREAAGALKPRRLGGEGRPIWLIGSNVELHREPCGVVLVVGPANYPILLPGVQILQALVAGNAVLAKPGSSGGQALGWLARALSDAGLPEDVLHVLSEDVESATTALENGVDKVVLTGSVETGRQVLRRLAESVTPAVVELSGCDAVVVRQDADLDLVARAVGFGMTLNGGFTCIAPRRILAHRDVAAELERRLGTALAGRPAVPLDLRLRPRLLELIDDALSRGGRWVTGERPAAGTCRPVVLADVPAAAEILRTDLAAPVACILPVADDAEAIGLVAGCPQRLGASVFGREPFASDLARRLDVGVVVVNDMIVPTADPRVPFGGRGISGFGRTRGIEGLLEMTATKAVVVRRGNARPHLDVTGPDDLPLFEGFIRAAHASSLRRRLQGLGAIFREGRRRGSR